MKISKAKLILMLEEMLITSADQFPAAEIRLAFEPFLTDDAAGLSNRNVGQSSKAVQELDEVLKRFRERRQG